MTSGAPWSVKGIDPKAREIAKGLARRSGLTLGEWLNQVILEDNGTSDDPAPTDYAADRYGSDRRSASLAPGLGGEPYRRYEAPGHMGDEMARVGEALDRLSARIEAAEHRSSQAIAGIDESVASLLSRLTVAERDQTAVAARFEGAVDDLRTDQARAAERLRRIEQEAAGARSAEGIKAMEGALAKVANHLYESEDRTRDALDSLRQDFEGLNGRLETGLAGTGASELVEAVVARLSERLEEAEGRTASALRNLETSFANLDQRLLATESRLEGQASETGLRELAASLTARVDEVRVEMAEKIRNTADGRFDQMEQTLEAMSGHVQAAERRSAQAIEMMGHEVMRMADVLGRKVQDVETRSTQAIEQVGGEVRRIADTVESRLTQADIAGAAALERLGGEIARISERLAERIGDAERRSAQAIDDVGEQVSRVTDRLQDRQDRVTSELGERIRQSEERTARLLEDARARIDERLAETHRRLEAKAAEVSFATQTQTLAASAYGPTAYAGQAFTPPIYGEPIYIDPEVAPFGHDSFAASRPPAAARHFDDALASPDAEADPEVETAELEAEAFATGPFGVAAFDEPEALLAADEQALAAEADEAEDDSVGYAPDPFPTAETAVAAPLSQVSARLSDAANTLTPVVSPFAQAIDSPDVQALPGAAFAAEPFVAHAAPFEPEDDEPVVKAAPATPTETYVTTPIRGWRETVKAAAPDEDLDMPEPAGASAEAPIPTFLSEPHLSDSAAKAVDENLFAPRSPTTRELIEQARAASRAASAARPEPRNRLRGRARVEDRTPPQAGAHRQPARRRQASVWANALLISGAAAAMGVSVAGYALLSQKPSNGLTDRVAEALNGKSPAPAKALGAAAPGPILAEALTAKPIADAPASAAAAPLAAPAAPSPDAINLYGDATRRIESHDFSGVEALKKSANLGYAPAQFYLAKLYEGGEAGLHKDSAEARRWTERAAEGGDRKAMHNLALYYFEGTGGPKNTTTAAQWFRRAADLGLTDSQYNLGRLYEEGFGVAQNPAEAYKWYLIAARSGDAESRNSAQRVKGQLSVEAQSTAERAAMSFMAQNAASPTPVAQAAAVSPVATAQRALSHLGYYQGPTDGVDSPALKLAIAAYQRDQGLPASGALDPTLNQRLSIIAQ